MVRFKAEASLVFGKQRLSIPALSIINYNQFGLDDGQSSSQIQCLCEILSNYSKNFEKIVILQCALQEVVDDCIAKGKVAQFRGDVIFMSSVLLSLVVILLSQRANA